MNYVGRHSHWPCNQRRGSAAASLLGLRVRIQQAAWMSVSCECCVLSGRDLCEDLITRPEESCRVWCVWVWSWSLDNESLIHWGLLRHAGRNYLGLTTLKRNNAHGSWTTAHALNSKCGFLNYYLMYIDDGRVLKITVLRSEDRSIPVFGSRRWEQLHQSQPAE